MIELSDKELCDMYLQGNEDAFETLWKKYKGIASKAIYERKFILQHYEMEDMMSECSIKFLDAINTYDGRVKLSTYYHTIIDNFLNSFLDKMDRPIRSLNYHVDYYSSYEDEDNGESLLDRRHEGKNDDYSDIESNLQKILNKALSKIPYKYRHSVEKRMTGEIQTDKQLAETIGISRQNARRYRIKVKEYVKNNYKYGGT